MAKREIRDPHVQALFVEIAASRMILHVLLDAVIDRDEAKAWEDIETMVTLIERKAAHAVVGQADPESSAQIVRSAAKTAVEFVRSVRAAPGKQ